MNSRRFNASVSRASNRKIPLRETTALRDFKRADGRCGSSATEAVDATSPCTSALPQERTFGQCRVYEYTP